jgi:NADPH-dependent glutamate synthase beta subunit-like oxidoreductase/ferredoxin
MKRLIGLRPMTDNKNQNGAVMIVGANIIGCQAALDLANSGLKVYLIDKNPSIEEVINLSEKDYLIKDCTRCIVSTKLIDIEKNPNIELITNADIVKLEGKPGKFNALISKKAKEIVKNSNDNASIDCFKQCSVQVPDELPFSQDISLKILLESRRIPPCENSCPAHVKSQEYIDLIRKKKYQESLDLIRERCPLPSVIGRVCTRPCEDYCNRGEIDEPVNICGLKRFVADYVRENFEEKIEFLEDKKEKKVGIVGSGPSSLSVAYHLARRGYPVTIFEREPLAGGMLRLGIPNYRLPPDILDADINYIKKFGVKIKVNQPIGPPGPTIKELRKDFDAVYLGVGLSKSRKLNIEGGELENIIYVVDFLKNCSLGKKVILGKRTLVIGGGDVAIDAARTAIRIGAEEVHLVMLESEDIIPAHPWEVEEAKEEGIIFHTSRGPKRFVGKNGKVTGLETLFCSSVFDKNGQFNPVLEECTEEIIEGDTIIVSIGQTSDLDFLDKEIKVLKGIEVDKKYFLTSMPGVFAGGEIVKGPGAAIEAIASGNKVAIAIDKYLKGEDLSKIDELIPDYDEKEIVSIDEINNLEIIPHEPRRNNTIIIADKRKNNFNEFTFGMDEDTALEEANRCLSCGICNECFNNINTCLASVISHENPAEILNINIDTVILTPGENWISCFDLRRNTNYRWRIIHPTAIIDEEKCIACGECKYICAFNAIERNETAIEFKAIRDSINPSLILTRYKSKVISDLCEGCGACIGVCPVGAISLKYFSNQQISKLIETYLK